MQSDLVQRLRAALPQVRSWIDEYLEANSSRARPVSSYDWFAAHQNRSFDGITFKDTFFVREDRQSESLHFHELVHVVQWARLGPDKFLLAYAVGLAQLGYEKSPLEQMAYDLQAQFEGGKLPNKPLVPLIEETTDHVWSHAQQFL
jgi:hypothetical protein